MSARIAATPPGTAGRTAPARLCSARTEVVPGPQCPGPLTATEKQ